MLKEILEFIQIVNTSIQRSFVFPWDRNFRETFLRHLLPGRSSKGLKLKPYLWIRMSDSADYTN